MMDDRGGRKKVLKNFWKLGKSDYLCSRKKKRKRSERDWEKQESRREKKVKKTFGESEKLSNFASPFETGAR